MNGGSPLHFVDITGTLKELGPGATIEFNARNGTRQHLTLCEWVDVEASIHSAQIAAQEVLRQSEAVQRRFNDLNASLDGRIESLRTELYTTTRLANTLSGVLEEVARKGDRDLEAVGSTMDGWAVSLVKKIVETNRDRRQEIDELSSTLQSLCGQIKTINTNLAKLFEETTALSDISATKDALALVRSRADLHSVALAEFGLEVDGLNASLGRTWTRAIKTRGDLRRWVSSQTLFAKVTFAKAAFGIGILGTVLGTAGIVLAIVL